MQSKKIKPILIEKKKTNFWFILSMILLIIACVLTSYIIQKEINSKPQSMQIFYNIGSNQGAYNLLNDYCDDGLINIQGQRIPLIKLCEAR